MAARTVRILIITATAAAVIAALLWFFVFRPVKVQDPFMMVPADVQMVALINRDALLQHATGQLPQSGNIPQTWSDALTSLDHPWGLMVLQFLLDGADANKDNPSPAAPVMCVIHEKSANHLVWIMPVINPVRLTGQMRTFQRPGMRIDRQQGFTRYFWKDFMIAHNDHHVIAVTSPSGTLQTTTSAVLNQLVGAAKSGNTFGETPMAQQLLKKEGALVAWISSEPLLEMLTEPGILSLIPGLAKLPHPKGYLASLDFRNGSIMLDANAFQPQTSEPHTQSSSPDPRHFRHHPSHDLLVMSAIDLPFMLQNEKLQEREESPLPELFGSTAFRDLLPIASGNAVLSLYHKDARLGSMLSELLSGYSDLDDPFSMISPVVIMTMEINGQKYDEVIPELIRKKLLTTHGNVLQIRVLPSGAPPSARKFLTFWLHRHGNMAIITNKLSVARQFNETGIPEAERLPMADQQRLTGSVAFDLRIESLYRLLANPNDRDFMDQFLEATNRISFSFSTPAATLDVRMNDSATSPVFQLLSLITGDANRRKP